MTYQDHLPPFKKGVILSTQNLLALKRISAFYPLLLIVLYPNQVYCNMHCHEVTKIQLFKLYQVTLPEKAVIQARCFATRSVLQIFDIFFFFGQL